MHVLLFHSSKVLILIHVAFCTCPDSPHASLYVTHLHHMHTASSSGVFVLNCDIYSTVGSIIISHTPFLAYKLTFLPVMTLFISLTICLLCIIIFCSGIYLKHSFIHTDVLMSAQVITIQIQYVLELTFIY